MIGGKCAGMKARDDVVVLTVKLEEDPDCLRL